jgi:hypothetical protein
MKRLELHFIQPPEVSGFNDRWSLLDDNGVELAYGKCSCGPNWVFPAQAPDKSWKAHYGYLETGLTFLAQCITHPEYGPCILYNAGSPLLAAGPNPNHQGEWYVDQVLFHHSFPTATDPDWRGSAACTTAPQDVIDALIAHLTIGERLVVSTIHGGCA